MFESPTLLVLNWFLGKYIESGGKHALDRENLRLGVFNGSFKW